MAQDDTVAPDGVTLRLDLPTAKQAKRIYIKISIKSGVVRCPTCGVLPISEEQMLAVKDIKGMKKTDTIRAMHHFTSKHISKNHVGQPPSRDTKIASKSKSKPLK